MTNFISRRFIAKSLLILPIILIFSAPIYSQLNICDNMPVTNCSLPPNFVFALNDNNTLNTAQPGEPRPNYPLDTTPLNSGWIKISPNVPGVWTIDTNNTSGLNSPFDTEIAIYRDDVGNAQFADLTKIANNDKWETTAPDDGGCFPLIPLPTGVDPNTSCVRFFMTPPFTYFIQYDGVGSQTGDIQMNFRRMNPTAAAVTIAGRIKDSNGQGLGNTTISLTGADGNIVTTISNQFGYYSFKGIEAGQTVIVEAHRKGFQFNNNPRVINVDNSLTGLDFEGFSNSFYKRE